MQKFKEEVGQVVARLVSLEPAEVLNLLEVPPDPLWRPCISLLYAC